MRDPQDRQRPRSISHDRTGTLSIGATGASHCGQCDGGRTTDWRSGTRWMTTLRNEPTASPTRPHTIATNAVTAATLTLVPRPIVHPGPRRDRAQRDRATAPHG